jgi:hypothetical protein
MKQPDRTLVAALDPFMTAHGFKFIKSREVYVRKTPLGFEDFSWSSYPLATGEKWAAGYHEGGYGLGLRSDAVAVVHAAIHPNYGERDRPTVYRPVGSPNVNLPFNPTRDRELCLRFDHLEADVAETVGRIQAMLEADGWAWYRRYADPAALSRDINEPIGGLGSHLLVNNPETRPLVGLAAACVGEPARVSELIEEWRDAAQKADEYYAVPPKRAAEFMAKAKLITEKAQELGYLS